MLKIWMVFLSFFRVSRCRYVSDVDYWTGDKVKHYLCGGKRWLCRYYVKSVIDGGNSEHECLRAYNTAWDDYVRCGDDDAVREKLSEVDKHDSVHPDKKED